jgi:hypothetical protein
MKDEERKEVISAGRSKGVLFEKWNDFFSLKNILCMKKKDMFFSMFNFVVII